MNRREFLNISKAGIITSAFISKDLLAIEPPEIRTPYFYLEENQENDFQEIRRKLNLIQRHVGYGNFNILGLDEALKIAKSNSSIGEFTKSQLEFLEFMFYYNPSSHGFYGKRITNSITDEIKKKRL